jgi:hypothetical protein
MPDFLAVLVLFCLADSLVSSTTMVRMSPTFRARLSATSRRADDSDHRDPLAASKGIDTKVITARTWTATCGERNWRNSFMGIGDFWTIFIGE